MMPHLLLAKYGEKLYVLYYLDCNIDNIRVFYAVND